MDISVFDELQANRRKESTEFDLLSGLDDLEKETIPHYDDIVSPCQ
jgi:hypothetical protein